MPEVSKMSVFTPEVEAVASDAAEPAANASRAAARAVEGAARDAAEQMESIQDVLIDTVTANQQEAIDTVESASQAMLEMITRTRAEITDFVAERIRQDLDTQKAFLRCRSLDEVRDVQARFVRTALDQYGGEAAKLLRIGGEVAAKSLERARA